ncbi:DUF1194 domain-containing protein [Rhodovulum sulfidophilum]|uniref:DUF1194 domain-containing protein n=1 Tax=Rhodovulum sulfidophilum TaxID=35806 RepID=UPI0019216634|nr:DUF1194 domain-containing protein [Rhodovulum sulfidophilum]MBL3562340.1 DUF1194 domain-containing protein [Rhodovulum sulfidophilum]
MSPARSAWKYRLKRDGLASALLQPEVQAAFPHIPSAPVVPAIFEWSGMLDQRLILSWAVIDSPAALTGAADRLRRTGWHPAAQSTAISAALDWGERLLAEGGACWQATLDLNADSTSNDGPQPRKVAIGEVTVNALAIGIGASVRVDHAETDLANL